MALTDPYVADVAARTAGSAEHAFSINAHPRYGDPYPLDVETLSVTFNETWSPFIQGSLKGPVPLTNGAPDQSKLDALDPRIRTRAKVFAGYVYPDGTRDVHQLADLLVDEREVNRPENTVQLSLQGDEIRAQQYLKVSGYVPVTTAGEDLITALLPRVTNPGESPRFASGFAYPYGAGDLAGITWDRGTSLWDLYDEAARRTDAWVYVDGDRTWNYRPRPVKSGTRAHTLKVGTAGTVIKSKASLSTRDWYNAVHLKYSWRDSAGAEKTVYGRASVDGGTKGTTTVGWITYYEERNHAATTAQANKACAVLLRKMFGRGRSLTLTAVSAYWLRPGHTVRVELPTGDPEDWLVESVTFHLHTGSMDVTVRQPENVTITEGE